MMKSANKLTVTTPTDRQIVMTRSFDAPRRLVWAALTSSELIRRWLYAPDGWTMTTCDMDVRVGGPFRWSWDGPDGKPAMTVSGEHREVDPPNKLVHTERMRLGSDMDLGELLATIELTEKDERTTLRMTLLFNSKQERDGALQSGMERGVSAGYDTLDDVLKTIEE
jgi:uncharacterized protein YndB with AHSA1/START domain